jgi:hypothetical protein
VITTFQGWRAGQPISPWEFGAYRSVPAPRCRYTPIDAFSQSMPRCSYPLSFAGWGRDVVAADLRWLGSLPVMVSCRVLVFGAGRDRGRGNGLGVRGLPGRCRRAARRTSTSFGRSESRRWRRCLTKVDGCRSIFTTDGKTPISRFSKFSAPSIKHVALWAARFTTCVGLPAP